MSNTVLITGGFGYVGGRIAQALASSAGTRVLLGTHRSDLTPPSWLPDARIMQMNFTSDASLDAACGTVDAIVHLAALNEIESAAHPDLALQVTTLGTLKLVQAAKRQGVKRFLYFSTAHVYKAPLIGTITEQLVPRPVHPYAITHKAAEDFVLAAHDNNSLTSLVVRLSNGFGAPAHSEVNRWTLVANDLCRQAVTHKTLTLKSAGLQKRDFITLTDVSHAVSHLLSLPTTTCADGIFNLGGENPLRIIDLAERIADRCNLVLGFRPEIFRPEPRPEEISDDLDYRIDKLKATGFFLQSDMQKEIDATLRLCQQAFRTTT